MNSERDKKGRAPSTEGQETKNSHSETGRQSNKYTCSGCGRGFNRKKYLNKHLCPNSTEPFVCAVCRQGFFDNAEFLFHKLYHIIDGWVQCHKCPRWFSNVRNRQNHLRSNSSCDKYKCEICHECFPYKYHFEMHRPYCNKEQEVEYLYSPTPSCSTTLNDSGTQKSRLITTDGTQNYSVAGHQNNLADFGSFHHNTAQQRTDSQLSDEDEFHIECNQCGRLFAKYRYLKYHISVNPFCGYKYMCKTCKKFLERQLAFEKHKHNLSKLKLAFICVLCGQDFNDRGEFDLHDCTDNAERNMKCELQNGNDQAERRVKCERCSKLFSTVYDCDKHLNDSPFCYMVYK